MYSRRALLPGRAGSLAILWPLRLTWLSVCAAFGMIIVAFAPTAHAEPAPAIGMSVTPVLGGYYTIGEWLVLHVRLTHNGTTQSGVVQARFTVFTDLSYSMVRPTTIAANQDSDFFLYTLPLHPLDNVELIFSNGNNTVLARTSVKLQTLDSRNHVVALMGRSAKDVGQLPVLDVYSTSFRMVTTGLALADVPDRAEGLRGIHTLVIDNVDTHSLSVIQRSVLVTWVEQGGHLILAGANTDNWEAMRAGLLPDLLPVEWHGQRSVTRLTSAYDVGSLAQLAADHADGPNLAINSTTPNMLPPDSTYPMPGAYFSINSPLAFAQVTPAANATIDRRAISPGMATAAPLIVSRSLGAGGVAFLGIDLLDPLLYATDAKTGRPETAINLWESTLAAASPGTPYTALQKTLFDDSLVNPVGRALLDVPPPPLPDAWLILVAGALLIVVLSGGTFTLIRHRMIAPEAGYAVLLPGIALCVGIMLWLGSFINAGDMHLARVSVAEFDADGTNGKLTQFVAIHSVSTDNFSVSMSSADHPLLRPLPITLSLPLNSSSTFGTLMQGAQVSASNPDIRTTAPQTLAIESPASFTLSLDAHLETGLDSITGTLSNTSGYAINDATLVYAENYYALGRLEAGDQRTIKMPLAVRPGFAPAPGIDPHLVRSHIPGTSDDLRDKVLDSLYSTGHLATQEGLFGLYFVGWADSPTLSRQISVSDHRVAQEDALMVVRPLPLAYDHNGTYIVPSPALLASRSIYSSGTPSEPVGTTPTGIIMENVSVLAQFRLPPHLRNGRATQMTLWLGSERLHQPVAPHSVEAYDWQRGVWTPLMNPHVVPEGTGSAVPPIVYDVPNPALYISPEDGLIRFRVGQDAPALSLHQLNISLAGSL